MNRLARLAAVVVALPLAACYHAVVAVAFPLAACYHAVIETGRPASSTVITRSFQPSFIYGLVPPPPLNVSGQCTGGVARVETLHSFVEGLVAGITFGIFTPMTLRVTCATGGTSLAPGERMLDVGEGRQGDAAALDDAIAKAAALSARTGHAVYVRF